MPNLKKSLEVLYELDALRNRAKDLRGKGRRALSNIRSIKGEEIDSVNDDERYKKWISTGNKIEAALLVKVQDHKNLSADEKENDSAEARPVLKEMLEVTLPDLFTALKKEDDFRESHHILDRRIPVLLAARTMQALAGRSKTVLSTETMLCYYRIVRELHTAMKPDWTVGGARAGEGGSLSAFVTGGCVSAILALEHSIKRTVDYFNHTRSLIKRHSDLKDMVELTLKFTKDSKIQADAKTWADSAIERMWFDWYISTNNRLGEIALLINRNQPTSDSSQKVDMEFVEKYVAGLKKDLLEAIKIVQKNIKKAKKDIKDHRNKEKDSANTAYQHTESPHQFAYEIITNALSQATEGLKICGKSGESLDNKLDALSRQFSTVSHGIHRVLEPSKRYIETVLNRELAESATGQFDAGELVFAAAAFGAMTDWKEQGRLKRACKQLMETFPDDGILHTNKPIHSTRRGYKLLPIECEITRRLAQLLERTDYEFEPAIVRKMINSIEEQVISIPSKDNKEALVGWNFDGATNIENPSVWVTAATVLTLDRIVRMLNARINEIVFENFEVIRPEQPRTHLTLNELIYPDYGAEEKDRSIAIHLEQMRAHIMRTTLPDVYTTDKKREKVFSTLLDGPPSTGKTSLAEALAVGSKAPLIMLSPFDLTLAEDGQSIEGRAKAVFEALSMLTQSVILFDEFESVLRQRQKESVLTGDGKASSNPTNEVQNSEPSKEQNEEGSSEATPIRPSSQFNEIFLSGVGLVVEAIGRAFESSHANQTNEFLLTGMLPQLIKLHDAAQSHSFVYFLATNHKEKLDPAAVRDGRFDVRKKIDHPDLLSVRGTFLYRLQRILSALHKQPRFKKGWEGRLKDLGDLIESQKVSVSDLANKYFKLPSWVNNKKDVPADWEKDAKYFLYVVTDYKVDDNELNKIRNARKPKKDK